MLGNESVSQSIVAVQALNLMIRVTHPSGAWLIVRGDMTLGQYTSFGAYLSRFFQGYEACVNWFVLLKKNSAQTQRYFDLLDRQPLIRSHELARVPSSSFSNAAGVHARAEDSDDIASSRLPGAEVSLENTLKRRRRSREDDCGALLRNGNAESGAGVVQKGVKGDGKVSRASGGMCQMEFLNVEFSYPSRLSRSVLGGGMGGIRLKVLPGEKVALVGQSGAGKSTLLKLVMRFYDPSAGSVLIDGTDLRQVLMLCGSVRVCSI